MSRTIEEKHFGGPAADGGVWDGHRTNTDFDFYCVAHDSEYSPKYLNGGVCHDGYEGYCHPECRRCPKPCPITPCPLVDEYGDPR